MTHLLLLILLLLPVQALAPVPVWANGETLYVRPTGACANNGDGTAYGCAASAGAAGAYIGFANILHAATDTVATIDPGDTLYICGAHTSMWTVPRSGTISLQFVADGACPSDAGSITVGSAEIAAIQQTTGGGLSYWTFQNLTLSGGTTGVVYCNGSTPLCLNNIYQDLTLICTDPDINTNGMRLRRVKNNIIRRNTLTSVSAACASGILIDSGNLDSSTFNNNVIEFNSVSGFPAVAIRFKGNTNWPIGGPNYIRDNEVFDNGDGLYPIWADGIVNQRNLSHDNVRQDEAAAEGYGYAGLWSEDLLYEDNEAYGNYGRCIEIFAGSESGAGPDIRSHLHAIIRRNYCHDNNVGAFTFNAAIDINNGPSGSTGAWDFVEVHSNYVEDSSISFGADTGVTADIWNNTFINPTTEACMYVRGPDGILHFENNLCVMGAAQYWFRAVAGIGASTTFSHNLIHAGGTTSLALINARTYTAADIAELDPNIVLANPLLNADGTTQAGSPARGAGMDTTGTCEDFYGVACPNPTQPDIGAFQFAVAAAVTGLHLVGPLSNTLAAFTWLPSADAGLLGYTIYRGTAPGATSVIATVTPATAATARRPLTLYYARLLLPATYYFAVAANTAEGIGTKSTEISVTVTGLSARTAR